MDPHSDGILLTGKIASEVTLGYKELDFIESSAFAEMNGYKNLAINGRRVQLTPFSKKASNNGVRFSIEATV